MTDTPSAPSPAELDVRTGSGIRLHVRLNGPQDGPPAILLHGFPEFWRGWAQVGDRLAQAGFRVIIPDQRGYNLSDKPTGAAAYAINTLSADVLALADALGIERFCLAGHDWGAAVAWHTAIHCPQRVQKLAILNVPHPDVMVSTLRSSFTQLLKSWYIFFFQIPALPEMLLRANDYAGLKRMLLSSGKHAPGQTPTFTAQDLQAYRDAWAQPGALTAMINWYRAAFRAGARTRPGVRRVSVPTLMLWG
ncbi:MAG: alpha/beta fold hydrolase, partial [Anaerolineae bacterium]|nr:alpha/beta fold hydrolase [Anaerolineae bacterium]